MDLVHKTSRKVCYTTRYAWLCSRGMRWLFVLGHMRSGSSLLVHLLNANPEVLGYGETPIRYTGHRSFVELHDHVREQFRIHGEPPRRGYQYVMDKILWQHIHNDNLLRQVPLSVIVIVRRPEAALPSILALDIESIQTSEEALRYYRDRLERLQSILDTYNAPFMCTTYSELTKRPEAILQDISEYLALDEKLTPTYDTMWATGKPVTGDPSEKIEAGEVRSEETSYDMDIASGIIPQAREAYRQFHSFCDDLNRQ